MKYQLYTCLSEIQKLSKIRFWWNRLEKVRSEELFRVYILRFTICVMCRRGKMGGRGVMRVGNWGSRGEGEKEGNERKGDRREGTGDVFSIMMPSKGTKPACCQLCKSYWTAWASTNIMYTGIYWAGTDHTLWGSPSTYLKKDFIVRKVSK